MDEREMNGRSSVFDTSIVKEVASATFGQCSFETNRFFEF
jgi:hypothetical protein